MQVVELAEFDAVRAVDGPAAVGVRAGLVRFERPVCEAEEVVADVFGSAVSPGDDDTEHQSARSGLGVRPIASRAVSPASPSSSTTARRRRTNRPTPRTT